MQRVIALVMAVVVVWPLTVRSAEVARPAKAGEFPDYCSTNKAGCADVISYAHLILFVSASSGITYCDRNNEIGQEHGVDIVAAKVVAWIRAHPELNDDETVQGVIKAMEGLYPCERRR